MADQEQLALLAQGVVAWNHWREERHAWEEEASLIRWKGLVMPRAYPHLVDLSGADLEGWELPGVNLQGANVQGANMKHANLQGAQLQQADGRGANLVGANLKETDLSRSNLERAEMDHAVMSRASLGSANLWNASLKEANLVRASCRGAFLAGVNFSHAALVGTDFTWTIVSDADFSDAYIASAIFGDVDLSVARGLEMARYGSPSIIDVRTLARSSGRIPPVFLERSGINAELLPALLPLFHGYHGQQVWWSNEEQPCSPWLTGERPHEPPRPVDEDMLPDLDQDG